MRVTIPYFIPKLNWSTGDRNLLAEKVGITHQSIVGYEAERGAGVRLDIVGRLAEALHIAPSWLAYGTGPRFFDETSASMEIPMLATSMRGFIDQPSHFFIAPGL